MVAPTGNATPINPLARQRDCRQSGGPNGFQNNFTGSEGNIHVSWLGRMNRRRRHPLQQHLGGGLLSAMLPRRRHFYPEPIHDGWPSHNAGWPNLTSTWIEKASVRVAPDGRVFTVGVGPRMVTTFNAYQKMPRHTATVFEGQCSPGAAYVRVFEPDLSALAYSSSSHRDLDIRRERHPPSGPKTRSSKVSSPTDNGVLVTGRTITDGGVARGNPIPPEQRARLGGLHSRTASPASFGPPLLCHQSKHSAPR